jgi:predicted amidohydrolase
MTGICVATAQFELRPEPTLAGFLDHVAGLAGAASSAGADVLVLPELVTTGLLASAPDAGALRVADLGRAYRDVFPPLTEAWAEGLAGLAAGAKLTILGGSHWRRHEDGSHRNTALLAHADGRVERYDKLHLTPPERALGTAPGDDVLITAIGDATVAIQICADIEFPEVSRHLALQGVEVILCPSLTWNRRGANRVRCSSLARSIENQLFVAVSTLIGTCGIPSDGALHGTGHAMVTCPIDRRFGINDGVLAVAGSDHEDLVVADLDLDMLRASREDPEPPGLKNIRPELYARLHEQKELTARGT